MLTTLLRGFIATSLCISSAYAYEFANIATISQTVNNRVCVFNINGDSSEAIDCGTAAPYVSSAGNVGIGTTGPRAALDITSSDSGSASPHANYDELVLENSGATGITIMSGNTDPGGIVFVDPDWSSSIGRGWMYYHHGDDMLALGANGGNRLVIDSNGNVGIGTTSPNASAKLEVNTTSGGFLPPRMTTAQRDAISSPAEGLMIYNYDNEKIEWRTSTGWSTMAQISCVTDTSDFLPTMAAISQDGYTVNWSSNWPTFDGWKAFDDDYSGSGSAWHASSGNTTGWLSIQLPTAKKVVTYKLAPRGTVSGQEPKNWTFEGSNDGTDWTVLDTQTDVTSWTNEVFKTYDISNETEYTYYRINVSASNSGYLAIGEMELLAHACTIN